MVSETSSIKTPEDNVIANPMQFTSLFNCAVFSFTLEADTMPADGGGGETQEVALELTVPGAALGDFIYIAPAVDVVGTSIVAYVTAANTITLQIENLTGADSTAFDTATKGFVGLILRFKPNVIYDLKD